MKATYWQRGETLDYTPENAVGNGEVVSLGTRIGVAGGDIKAGELGRNPRSRKECLRPHTREWVQGRGSQFLKHKAPESL